MIAKIEEYIAEVEAFQAVDAATLEEFRIRFLGKKGVLAELFDEFKKAPVEQKKEIGDRNDRIF